MDLASKISFLCVVLQGLAAMIFLHDRISKTTWKAPMSRWKAIVLAVLLIVAPLCTVALGFWIYYNPPKPVVVERQVAVEKPCPPSKSGAATTKGTQAPAITGSNNAVNYGQAPPRPKQ